MYKVGDYVMFKPEGYSHEEIGLITDIDSIYHHITVIRTMEKDYLAREYNILRPAVLSDWAKEIPEKYRNECADDERYIWLISYPNNEVGIVLSANNNSNQGYLVDEKWFIADALSAHYGIPIMPYETYKEYMEGK